MSPLVLIFLAALVGFVVGWFAHGPKEPAPSAASLAAARTVAPPPNPLAAEVERLKQHISAIETFNAGHEAMVHARDATIVALSRRLNETAG